MTTINQPGRPGAFEGDIFYGDPEQTTRPTHRWSYLANGIGGYAEWIEIPAEAYTPDEPGEPTVAVMPKMEILPALTQHVKWAIDTSDGEPGLLVGPGHIPNLGPALFIGARTDGGTATIAALMPDQWAAFSELMRTGMLAIIEGNFDGPVKQDA